jgi:hypothetical protein
MNKETLKDKYHDCGHRPRNTDKRKRRMAKVKDVDNKLLPESAPPKAVGHGQGWECPRCHTINAPFATHCTCRQYHEPWNPYLKMPPWGWTWTSSGAPPPLPGCQTICMH